MYGKILSMFLLIIMVFFHYNCAPSLRSAKVDPGFSVDGVILGTYSSTSATDEQGNDATSDTEFDNPIPLDVKFRYGWEREKNFGFELNGGLDGQMGFYLELPGTETFHWGIGAETNFWLMVLSRSLEEDEEEDVADFITENNYHIYLMAGFIPSPKLELSAGIKYQPFLDSFLEAISETDINVSGTLPVTYMLDGRYMLSKHWGIMGGAEFFDLSFSGEGQSEASLSGGYVYIGVTFR